MRRRQTEKDLYRQLKLTKFDFMPRGVFNIEEIYLHIKENYPTLCDDEYRCSFHCSSGVNQPEWKHVTRQVLSNLKTLNIDVRKSEIRSYWEFL
jgi:hypothetical protein